MCYFCFFSSSSSFYFFMLLFQIYMSVNVCERALLMLQKGKYALWIFDIVETSFSFFPLFFFYILYEIVCVYVFSVLL